MIVMISQFAFADVDISRAKNIYSQIRCATCQGQSIADSNSEHAKMMREYIDKQVALHKSDEQIFEEIRSAYGDYLVFDPKFSIHTFMLWLLPFVVVMVLFVIVFRRVKDFHSVQTKI